MLPRQEASGPGPRAGSQSLGQAYGLGERVARGEGALCYVWAVAYESAEVAVDASEGSEPTSLEESLEGVAPELDWLAAGLGVGTGSRPS